MSRKPFDPVDHELSASTLLLEASAGTGKTWSLTTIAARLVLDGTLPSIEGLLVVTFTRAATHELRERLRQRLREARDVLRGADPGRDVFLRSLVDRSDRAAAAMRIDAALRDYDLVRVSTIHGFCARLLQDTAFEAGLAFEAEEAEDPARMRGAALADAWRAVVHGGPAWRAAWAHHVGFDFATAAKAFDLARRQRGAEHRPAAPALEAIDGRVATAWDAIVSDAAFRDDVLAFLEKATRKTDPGAMRAAALRSRLADGTLRDDAQGWLEWLTLFPEAAEKIFTKKFFTASDYEAIAARLEPLRETLSAGRAALRHAVLTEAAARFDRAKRAAGVRDFDDMIVETRARLEDPSRGAALIERVRAQIDTALIDEFQDTDSDQWAIFSTLFTGKRMILVGDPKQAIYGFRGADVFAYFDARDAADATATLPANHRSHPHLVEAVNHLFTARPDAFALDELVADRVEPAKTASDRSLGDGGPALHVEWIDEETVREDLRVRTGSAPDKKPATDAYRAVATRRTVESIADLVARTPQCGDDVLHPGHVAVLTRRHAESQRIHEALRRAGIDAVIAGSGDVRTTEVFADLVRVLEAVVDPTDPRTVRRARATRVWGDGVASLADDDAAADAVTRFEELRRTWERHGVFAVLARVAVERAVEDRWLRETDGERAVTDLRHAMEFVHDLERERDLRPEALVHALWNQHDHAAAQDGDADATRLRLERDEKAVKIVTMHTSKGLEYDVVFVPYAWDAREQKAPWTFHEPGGRVVDWESDQDSEAAHRARAGQLAEEMRLLYVALTRATRRCVVFDADHVPPKLPERQFAPLHFLLHRDDRPPDESIVDWVTRCLRTRGKDRTGWRAQLDPLAALDGVTLADATGHVPVASRETPPPEESPRERPLPERVHGALKPWTVTSFTALARGVVDGPARLDDRDDPAAPDLPLTTETTGIFAFARGARAGNCLHEILEHSAFDARADDPVHRARLEIILRRHDLFDPHRHDGAIDPLQEVVLLVERVGRETFPGLDAPFAAIGAAQRRNEWEFRLPVERIALPDLGDAIAAHADLGDAVVDRLRTHRFPQVRGLFGGVVDLVFEHDGRYGIVDWKSNHLGNAVTSYTREAMHASMVEHDYYLQMLLYQVALHRFLRSRLLDYDYDLHCAGAAYAFLRGLDGTGEHGWIDWRPTRELVEAVDACFRTPRGEDRR